MIRIGVLWCQSVIPKAVWDVTRSTTTIAIRSTYLQKIRIQNHDPQLEKTES